MLFDAPFYQAINEARWTFAARTLDALEADGEPFRTCLDAGCGPGWFAERLAARGYGVLGVDGRAEVAQEARRRVPDARFEVLDFEATGYDEAPPPHDLVFCFGLLYHLESPVRALRMLRRATGRALFLETMTVPSEDPVGWLGPENPNETQGTRNLALILSPTAVAAALRASGFRHVLRADGGVDHDDFRDTAVRGRRRHLFLASDAPLAAPGFAAAPVASSKFDYAPGWAVRRVAPGGAVG